jgi:4-hydroxybenzoyl-CoA reductase subunit beta
MMRAPRFRYRAARSVKDAVAALAAEPAAMILAGGTDLVPNMKRRVQVPSLVVGIRHLGPLRRISTGAGLTLGSCASLEAVAGNRKVQRGWRALALAASKVATPHLRRMGTLGGNLCLDTRCTYYNQNAEWRESIDFCMKAPRGTGGHACASPDGTGICWVATSSPRCWAVSSSDTAPALIALGAEVTLVGPGGERRMPLARLYATDGMAYLTKQRDELLTAIHLPAAGDGTSSTYWKLRRRGSFDFPVLGVAAAIRFSAAGTVEDARIVLGAVESSPVILEESAQLIGSSLEPERIASVAEAATRHARPMDNTDFELSWRKKVVKSYVRGALEELRDRSRA